MILGIDPGLNGGLVFLQGEGKAIDGRVMPVIGGRIDAWALDVTFRDVARRGGVRAFLEMASSRPKQGVSSVFKFGEGFGLLQGLLVAHQIPFTLVTPQKWTKEMHQGIGGEMDPKKKSLIAVQRLFPGVDLRKSERCRVPHDGLVDALLIAEFGRRLGA
jgi:crossover junction endodeoxyribonuclease RuvC